MKTTSTTTATTDNRKPAYIAFKTFLTAIESLQEGLPPVIDRSVWNTFSGGLQGHTLNAFKFWGLVDEKGCVQPILQRLVNARGDDRKAVIKEILNDKYQGALELGRKNASFQQLQDYFRTYGVQGGTLEMVVRFFLDACKHTGEKGSPLWVKARKTMKRSRSKDGNGESNPPSGSGHGSEPNKPNAKVVNLKNGGKLSLSLEVDLMSLSTEDRTWLFGLIDMMNTYGQTSNK